jgi:hypothetical protein
MSLEDDLEAKVVDYFANFQFFNDTNEETKKKCIQSTVNQLSSLESTAEMKMKLVDCICDVFIKGGLSANKLRRRHASVLDFLAKVTVQLGDPEVQGGSLGIDTFCANEKFACTVHTLITAWNTMVYAEFEEMTSQHVSVNGFIHDHFDVLLGILLDLLESDAHISTLLGTLRRLELLQETLLALADIILHDYLYSTQELAIDVLLRISRAIGRNEISPAILSSSYFMDCMPPALHGPIKHLTRLLIKDKSHYADLGSCLRIINASNPNIEIFNVESVTASSAGGNDALNLAGVQQLDIGREKMDFLVDGDTYIKIAFEDIKRAHVSVDPLSLQLALERQPHNLTYCLPDETLAEQAALQRWERPGLSLCFALSNGDGIDRGQDTLRKTLYDALFMRLGDTARLVEKDKLSVATSRQAALDFSPLDGEVKQRQQQQAVQVQVQQYPPLQIQQVEAKTMHLIALRGRVDSNLSSDDGDFQYSEKV